MKVQLQPLRIPAGWAVMYNSFHDIAATPDSVQESFFFNEDLLQLRHEHYDLLLDLGWTPERNFENGSFHLVVYETDFHGKQTHDFRSKDKDAIVVKIERLCLDISNGKLTN